MDRLITLRRLIPALLLAPLLAGCNLVVMNPAGDVAIQQRNIILISTGLMLLIIIPVLVLIVLFAWRYRAGNAEAAYDPEFDHSTGLELIIWSAPLLIVIALGALTWWSTHKLDPFRPLERIAAGRPVTAAHRELHVQVVSLDWKWLFIYPELGIATVNQLVLPVDRPVRFDLTSTNMMNTFYAPAMAGMIYTMPGMNSTLHGVINKVGSYDGFSANYSGAGFSDMRFRLHGVSPSQFDAWVAAARSSGRTLDASLFQKLVQPSEKVAPIRFAGVQPDLYHRILERCVEPGQTCMSAIMRRDQAAGGGKPHEIEMGSGMPSGRTSVPAPGDKPTGGLLQKPRDIQVVPNRTAPIRKRDETGRNTPGDVNNRNMSMTNSPALGGTSVTARG